LGANVRKPNGDFLGLPWIIKDFSGFKVGIFGLLTTASKEYLWNGFSVTDELSAAEAAVNELKSAGADMVIALTHLGMDAEEGAVSSKTLAAAVPGIDLIIDGHSHTYIDEPVRVNGVPIVSAGEYGRYLGKADISVSEGKLKVGWQVIPVKAIAADKEFQTFISGYAEKARLLLETRLGSAYESFEYGDRLPSRGESAIGNLITDAAQWYALERLGASVDFVLINSGTIRSGLSKGEVKYEDLHKVIPFNDNLIVLEMKGGELVNLFEFIASIPLGNRGFPQVSGGVNFTLDFSGGGRELKNVSVGSSPIDPDVTYKILTIDFIVGGGNGYSAAASSTEIYNTGVKLSEAVAEYIKEMETIAPYVDGRIKILQ
jgi:5'-nucleotidase/UDP-sugar diphosphatase